MASHSPALLDHLATVANNALNQHNHNHLCKCGQWPDCANLPNGTWNIGDSLRLVLPELLDAYDLHKEQQ